MLHPSTRALPAMAIVLAACQAATPISSPSIGASSTVAVATPSVDPTPADYAGAAARIEMARMPRGVAVADGAIWVASTLGNVVQRVDPRTNAVVAEVDVGARPVTLVTLDGELWVSVLNGDPASDDELVRIDAATNEPDLRVSVPVHHNVAVGGGAIWVQDLSGNLRRVDPASGAVTDVAAVGLGPVALAANDEAVYGVRGSGAVWRQPIDGGAPVEADTGLSVPGRSRIEAAADGLWLAVPGTLLALDPASLEVLAELAIPGMTLVNDLHASDGDLWLSANVADEQLGLNGGAILRLDPATLEVRAAFRLGTESSGVAVADGSVWAVDQSDDVLARFPL